MMPFVPIVRVKDADAAIAASVKAEHGYRHTAIIHTNNRGNGDAHGEGHEHHAVHSECGLAGIAGRWRTGVLQPQIATPTGEGITTPLTFTRERQMVVRCAEDHLGQE